MSFPRSVTDDDLRDDCARVVGKMTSIGARIEIDPTPAADEWWRIEAPARAAKACRIELALTALLIGRGCGMHARRHGQKDKRERFGSRRLNKAFCRALREADAARGARR